jgi:anthranilate phosphoribosyltransferase
MQLRDGAITEFSFDASEIGLTNAPLEAIRGGDVAQNAAIAMSILNGNPGAPRDTVVLNAAAALYIAGVASTLQEGRELAEKSIDSGSARRVLDGLVTASNTAAKRLEE